MQSVCANRILNPARGSGAPELGSAVSSPSEVWGGAPADIEFGAIESQNLAFRGPQRPSLPGACAGIWGAKAPIWGGEPPSTPVASPLQMLYTRSFPLGTETFTERLLNV